MSYTPYNVNKLQYLTEVTKVGYVFVSGIITVALASETDFVLFKNTPASGKVVELQEQIVSLPGSANTVRTIVRIYKNPTITSNGVAVTIGGLRNGQAPSIATVFTAPVIASRGTLVQVYNATFAPVFRIMDLARYIEDGDNLLFTMQPSGATTDHVLSQKWVEVPS